MTINCPLCHKCSSAIIEWQETDVGRMGIMRGCKECRKIRSYIDAKKFCPLIVEPETKLQDTNMSKYTECNKCGDYNENLICVESDVWWCSICLVNAYDELKAEIAALKKDIEDKNGETQN